MHVKCIDDIWGVDLVEMQEWEKENEGLRYMLNISDAFSKFVWSEKLKAKTAKTGLDVFKRIIKNSKRRPKFIWVDEGKSFTIKL